MDQESEIAALRQAFQLMGLDPAKVAAFIAADGDPVCKAILFDCVGLDEAKLAQAAGSHANVTGWLSIWRQLFLPKPGAYHGLSGIGLREAFERIVKGG